MKQVKVALIGAGQRGGDAYAPYALHYPHQMKIVAVADPRQELRERMGTQYDIPKDMQFVTGEELLAAGVDCDAVILCTQDNQHFDLAMEAMDRGYHLLLEKPMSVDPRECIALGKKAEQTGVIFAICHVLRYTPFFQTIKSLLDEGRIGRLIDIYHSENVGYFHFAHSYVRGNWRKEADSSPMILAKCCHDLDILQWLADSECQKISSYGSLTYFKPENAPGETPARCSDGCRYEAQCPFSAERFYLNGSRGYNFAQIMAGGEPTPERVARALQEGPYGRCVFHCDNDVVDHQVAAIAFKNGVTATFGVSAFSGEISRTIRLQGTKGEIMGDSHEGTIKVIDFEKDQISQIRLPQADSGHDGGDFGLMRSFIRAVSEEDTAGILTSAKPSIHAHLMCFAAEKARVSGEIVDMDEFTASFQ